MRKYLGSSVFPTLLAGFACLSATNVATAQSASDLVGTWQLVSVINTAKDGAKSDVFGPDPKGMMILGPDGHFVQVLTRPGLPKFAAENRLQGTPDENKAIVQGSSRSMAATLWSRRRWCSTSSRERGRLGPAPSRSVRSRRTPATRCLGRSRRRWAGQTSQRSDASSRLPYGRKKMTEPGQTRPGS